MADTKKSPQKVWVEEITAAERELKKFHERGTNTNKRFLDERGAQDTDRKWFNIFYANTQILESALYAQLPKPSVSRKYKDFDDQVARVAGIMLERCISQDLDDPSDTFDGTVRHAVQDRLVPGLGQAWLRLETKTESIEDVPPQPDTEDEEGYMKISGQRVCVDYVYWKDFIWSPCRVWEERRWVGRKVYMDREALCDRFGEQVGNAVPLDYKPMRVGSSAGQASTPQDDTVEKAVIYELWERKTRKVFWVSKSYASILDEIDDPLHLTNFEPCPMPMLANVSTSNSTPRPDFYMLQDQYNELDLINHRISKLVQACKVVGVYDKSSKGVSRMLSEGFDNDMIPVDSWAAFAEKGGIKGQTDWLPLEQVVKALAQLTLAREAIKAQIYELTGIADIVRGASKASETLGAQEIKAKFASVRIKKLQDEVARFVAEILRIKAEIICRHFDDFLILDHSNIYNTPDAELAGQALELLKNPDSFEWRVVVTADSIAQADYDMEKKDRIEFLTAVSGYLEKAAAMFQAVPGAAPLLVAMLKWAVAGFKGATEIEGMLDKALDGLQKSPPPEKPDPEQQKLQLEQQKMQQQQQIESQKAQQQMQVEERKAQLEEQKAQMDMALQQQKNEMELTMQREMGQLKIWIEQTLAGMKIQTAQAQADQKQREGAMQMQQQEQQHAQQMQQQTQQHAMDMQHSRQDHQQQLETAKESSAVKIQTQKAEAKAKPKPTGGRGAK